MTKRKRTGKDEDKDKDKDNVLLPQASISYLVYLYLITISFFIEKTLPPASSCEPIFRSLSSLSSFTSHHRLVDSLSGLCWYRKSPPICRYRLRLWRSLDQSCSNIPRHSHAWSIQTSLIFQHVC